MKGIQYKKTFAAKGSVLYDALSENMPEISKRLYIDTTERFDKLYPSGHRHWFENWRNNDSDKSTSPNQEGEANS